MQAPFIRYSVLLNIHNLAVLYLLAVATYFQLGLKTTLNTELLWVIGLSVIGLPVAASHTRAILSLLAVTTYFPSEMKDERQIERIIQKPQKGLYR
jgi:hypothetical protein